jgi:Ca2+-binding RTX toxin-like protein
MATDSFTYTISDGKGGSTQATATVTINGITDDGGAGNDTLLGGDGNDTLHGGDGNDMIDAKGGNDIATGGDGNDVFVIRTASPGKDGRDEYHGGADIDALDFSLATDPINFHLRHSSTLYGPDRITGIEDLVGGQVGDRMDGNKFANQILGNAGDDVLKGEDGNDALDGGEGNDTQSGGNGRDHLVGNIGNDLLNGGAANDLLEGGDGSDTLAGGRRDDTLAGGAANDHISGGEGRDVLEGEDGDDTLVGGLNSDTLAGGAGDDALIGGDGFDSFRFDTLDGVDMIGDFATKGSSKDTFAFVRDLFESFEGDVSDLINDGFLRAQDGTVNHTNIQVDVDGGGDNFVTIAVLNGAISNSVLANQTVLIDGLVA